MAFTRSSLLFLCASISEPALHTCGTLPTFPGSGRKISYRRIFGTVNGCRTAGGRDVVGRLSSAPVSSAAPKKKVFDRGGPLWPSQSNAKYDRLGGGPMATLPPPAKNRVVWGAAPPRQIFSKKREKKKIPVPSSRYLTFQPFQVQKRVCGTVM